MRDVSTRTCLVGHHSIRLGGNLEFVDDLARVDVDEHEQILAINSDHGERSVSDPRHAFRLLAHLDLMQLRFLRRVSTNR